MRIQHVKIKRWRHFEDVEFSLPETAPIICVVGGNGTGKSQILELIAASAQRIGLATGNESSRGDPFGEGATFEVTFHIARNIIPTIDSEQCFPEYSRSAYAEWDRTITVSTSPDTGEQITTRSINEPDAARQVAQDVLHQIQRSESIHYLSLDADRAYPKISIATHQIGEAFDRDWENTAKQSSFRLTRNLYDEWFRYLIGIENQESSRHIQAIRLSRNCGQVEPKFVDKFDTYKDSVKKVLPHLLFLGIDPQTRDIRFDSTGVPLSFHQLSGGEREIAFLIGQIERFGLKKGLLLVDEPELHLNYDLLRSWIGFLKESVEEGQIWLASHSLEVVEVTGQDATFLLERSAETRRVVAARAISSQPIIATLSRAIGSPAFSISNLAFVLIEGEEEIGERERFRLLCDIPQHVRFLEAGSCKEVIRRIDGLRDLAAVSAQPLRIGGIIDGDYRTQVERDELSSAGVFVLAVHEVENFFLEPETLKEVMRSLRRDPTEASTIFLELADRRAGAWIFGAARTDRAFRDFREPSKEVRELVHSLVWSDFSDAEQRCAEIARAHGGLEDAEQSTFQRHLVARTRVYARKRNDGLLWRTCHGKEVLRSLAPRIGFANEDTFERLITSLWSKDPELLPQELVDLRNYINSL